MGLSITSFFRSKASATQVSSIIKRFTFNGSDVSARVTEYAEVSHNAVDFIAGDFVLELENASQTFNPMLFNKQQFYKAGTFEYGFATATGSEDLIQLYGGVLTKMAFGKGAVRLHFQDKLTRLKERYIGTDKTPVAYTSSNYNPADLAWYLVTSYGGLSVVASTSNPDIDYQTWVDWKAVFTGDSVVVQAHFKGEDVAVALEKIARLTDSTIFDEGDNALDFARWSAITSYYHTVTDSHMLDSPEIEISGDEMINKVDVLIGFDPITTSWTGTITRQNTPSVNSYGEHKEVYDDTNVWFVNSVAAINQADRITFRRKEPNLRAKIRTPLAYLDAVVGDMVYLTSRVHSFDAKLMTLAAYSIDVDNHTMVLEVDEGFGRSPGKMAGFILDDDYYGLLDQSYNALY